MTLPLHHEQDRCLGHPSNTHKDACPNRDKCARHLTISHPDEPWADVKPPYYTLCPNYNNADFIEVA